LFLGAALADPNRPPVQPNPQFGSAHLASAAPATDILTDSFDLSANDNYVRVMNFLYNTTPANAKICANLFIFNATGTMTSCCACPVDALPLVKVSSVKTNLLNGTAPDPPKGTITIIATRSANCTVPASVTYSPGVVAWINRFPPGRATSDGHAVPGPATEEQFPLPPSQIPLPSYNALAMTCNTQNLTICGCFP
jgi:hypothetical protein